MGILRVNKVCELGQLSNELSAYQDKIIDIRVTESFAEINFLNSTSAEDQAAINDIINLHAPTGAYVLEVENYKLEKRMAWGQQVLKTFRLYGISLAKAGQLSQADSIALYNVLSGLKAMLELGLLSDTAYVLNGMTSPEILNNIYQDGKTVKEFFVEYILSGNIV